MRCACSRTSTPKVSRLSSAARRRAPAMPTNVGNCAQIVPQESEIHRSADSEARGANARASDLWRPPYRSLGTACHVPPHGAANAVDNCWRQCVNDRRYETHGRSLRSDEIHAESFARWRVVLDGVCGCPVAGVWRWRGRGLAEPATHRRPPGHAAGSQRYADAYSAGTADTRVSTWSSCSLEKTSPQRHVSRPTVRIVVVAPGTLPRGGLEPR